MVKFSGASRKCYIFQFSQNVDGFGQNDSQGVLELFIKLCKQKPLVIREIFYFHYLPKLYIGFKRTLYSEKDMDSFNAEYF